jgi:allantoicase
VIPAWDAPIDEQARAAIGSGHPGMVDLAALRHGGRALSCSDMFFAPMNNLIAPGRSTYMGGGWETRRRRGPGHDWILLELAAPGTIGVVEVDTGHFHGNHAQRCSLWGVHVSEVEPGGPGSGRGEPKKARLADLLASDRTAGGWHEVLPASAIAPERWHLILPETTLGPDRRLFLSSLDQRGPFTHVRLETFPDGGVARLRLYGHPTKVSG